MIKIVVDSTADIPADLRDSLGITVVPVLLQLGGAMLRDGEDISRDEFYRRMVESQEMPTTSAPSIGMFEETFRSLAADGSDILSISLAGSLSSTFSAAQQAAQMVAGARIVCVDSRAVTIPVAYMAAAAARAAQAGRPIEQIAAMVDSMGPRAVIYVALETLRYLERGGRIGRMRALLGTMLSVKPILEVRNAEVQPVEQVRTWKRVPPRMVELAQARGAFEEISALYTTDRASAELLADRCAEAGLMPRERIRVVQASVVLGAHIGPGAIGLAGLLQ